MVTGGRYPTNSLEGMWTVPLQVKEQKVLAGDIPPEDRFLMGTSCYCQSDAAA